MQGQMPYISELLLGGTADIRPMPGQRQLHSHKVSQMARAELELVALFVTSSGGFVALTGVDIELAVCVTDMSCSQRLSPLPQAHERHATGHFALGE